MFKNLKKIGLGPLYQERKAIRSICRQILSLNLLPHDKIVKRFEAIEAKVARIKEDNINLFAIGCWAELCARAKVSLIESVPAISPAIWSDNFQPKFVNEELKCKKNCLAIISAAESPSNIYIQVLDEQHMNYLVFQKEMDEV